MNTLVRFGVSLKKGLLDAFDLYSEKRGFSNRSQALTFLIEEALLEQAEQDDRKDVCGAIVLIYDHHKNDFMSAYVAIQHDYHHVILTSQHIHVDHHTCLETITVKGKPSLLKELSDKILALKGIKHGRLVLASM
ncbi:MAG: nickel-responsive transcriptional regulator NikR [Spirochaetota bacterium]